MYHNRCCSIHPEFLIARGNRTPFIFCFLGFLSVLVRPSAEETRPVSSTQPADDNCNTVTNQLFAKHIHKYSLNTMLGEYDFSKHWYTLGYGLSSIYRHTLHCWQQASARSRREVENTKSRFSPKTKFTRIYRYRLSHNLQIYLFVVL